MTLLVAVADAAADQELVASARALAAAARWEVRGVHVREPGIPEPGSAELEGLEVAAIDGDPVQALTRLAGGAAVDAFAFGLSCSCTPGPTSPMGHVAEALLNSQVAPVLLVRPGMRPVTGLKRLYVPLEGSPSTSAAMRAADNALCARGREMVMLHVATGGDTPVETGSLPAPRMTDQEHYEWSAWQDEFTMRFSQCAEGGRHRVAVRVGDPAGVIAEEAGKSGAELIVLSWNGSFESGHGAVIRDLLTTAPCPLLLVPSDVPPPETV
jgi:nucleotide-binding universal stress UspA family protein